jgi:hypothetical protein
VIALGDCLNFSAFAIDPLEIDATLFRRLHEYVAAVRAPERFGFSAASGRGLVAAHATRDIEIVISREVFRLRSRLRRGHKKIGLAIRTLDYAVARLEFTMVDFANERQTAPIRAERKTTNWAIDRRDFPNLASGRVHLVDRVLRRGVI